MCTTVRIYIYIYRTFILTHTGTSGTSEVAYFAYNDIDRLYRPLISTPFQCEPNQRHFSTYQHIVYELNQQERMNKEQFISAHISI